MCMALLLKHTEETEQLEQPTCSHLRLFQFKTEAKQNEQKTSLKSDKTEIKILANPGLLALNNFCLKGYAL